MAPVICVAVSHPALSFDLERWFMAETCADSQRKPDGARDALTGTVLNDCVYPPKRLFFAPVVSFTTGSNASHASD
jgi:hypothetical protein